MDLITNFLNKLETMILNIDSELEYIRNNNLEYETIYNLLETLNNSKTDFSVTYYESSSEVKENIRNILLSVYNDEELVSNIINEIVNLYFLYHTGLLENDDLAEQKDEAIEALEDFEQKLSDYFSNKEHISENAVESRQRMKQKLIEIGSIFGNQYQSEIIDDVEKIDEVLKLLDLSDDEIVDLLAYIIESNTKLMKENILEEQNRLQEEIERNKEEVEKIIEQEDDSTKKIDDQTLSVINELLSKKDVIEKIVKLINEDARNIVISNPSAEEKEIIMSSLELAREYIIDKVLYEDLTPEEALQVLYKEHEKSTESILKELNEILIDVEEDIPYQEQIAIINKGTEFYTKHKKLLQHFSKQERKIVDSYMTSILYKSKDHRIDLYRNTRSYDNDSKLVAEATYEIKVILDLLDSLDSNCVEYKDILKKVSKRISDILDSVKTIELEKAKKEPPKEKEKPQGRLYYLMRNDKKSMFEDDVRPDDINKGISPEYYEELMEALELIKNRNTSNTQFSLPAQEGDNYLKKNGVQVTTTSRVKVLYIPIGPTDSIIVGVGFSDGKQFPLRDQDDRLRRYQFQLSKLKNDIENNYAEKEIRLSEETDKRIIKALKSSSKKTSLSEMFEQEEDKKPNKRNNGNGQK